MTLSNRYRLTGNKFGSIDGVVVTPSARDWLRENDVKLETKPQAKSARPLSTANPNASHSASVTNARILIADRTSFSNKSESFGGIVIFRNGFRQLAAEAAAQIQRGNHVCVLTNETQEVSALLQKGGDIQIQIFQPGEAVSANANVVITDQLTVISEGAL